MEPTLKTGQIVWVSNWYYLINKVRVGDIVLFRKNHQELIKRVKKISRDRVFLVGDNKSDSLDSRAFGKVSSDKILGKVITD